MAGKGQRSLDAGGTVLPDTPTQGATTPTQHRLRARENLNDIHDSAPLHTAHTHAEATDDVRTSHLAAFFFSSTRPH